MKDKVIFIIPAREGSKGFPHKNRVLFNYTLSSILEFDYPIFVTTDDEEIKSGLLFFNENNKRQITIINRPSKLAQDDTSMKDVLIHAISEIKPSDDTLVVVLYPTYPQRTGWDIECAIKFMEENNAVSLLCRLEYKGISPYLLMFDQNFGHDHKTYRGKQVISGHNLYRRQDYLPVFQISHYIIAFYPNVLKQLNKNLYNLSTIFMPIDGVIDIDTKEDYNNYLNKKLKT